LDEGAGLLTSPGGVLSTKEARAAKFDVMEISGVKVVKEVWQGVRLQCLDKLLRRES
jgi:hypothetical protein